MKEHLDYELLMSVMHQKDFFLAEQSQTDSSVLIINQCEVDGAAQEQHGKHLWKMLSTKERGLSKSRNMALQNATGDICQLCDDDEILAPGHMDIVLKAYEELPDADVIVFNLNRINYGMKKSYYRITEVREAPKKRSYGSPMITFRLQSIRKHNISFCEEFGSGSKFGGGEDGLFLADIRKAGLKVYEYPAIIATVDYSRFTSKWFHGYTDKYFYNQGVFHQYTKPNHWLYNVAWGCYLAYKLRRERINVFSILRWQLAGARGYKNGKLSYEEYLEKKK